MKIKDEKAGTKGHCPKCKTEFVVPEPDETEPSEAPAVEAKATAQASDEKSELTTEESLEDEYQRILMGDSPGFGGSRQRAPEPDSDAFLSVDQTDDEPPARGRDSHSDPDVKTDRSPVKSPARTTAQISAAMMKNTAEPTLKKTGKGFGEATSDKDSARNKLAAESRAYYAKQIGLLAVVVVVLGGGLYWLSSSMMGGAKYPPLGRVSGVVTMDGTPLPAATVTFQPILEGTNKGNVQIGASVGRTDAKGHYELYYVEGVRGAVVGKHFIQVRAQSDVGLEVVPDKFNANSTLSTEVKAGSITYDIPLTKN